MVGDPAHPQGESAETFDGAAKVFVEAGEDLMVDQGSRSLVLKTT
jgi:hypothetical protein